MEQYRIELNETNPKKSLVYIGGCGCCVEECGLDDYHFKYNETITKQDLLDAEEYFTNQLKALIPLKKLISTMENDNAINS